MNLMYLNRRLTEAAKKIARLEGEKAAMAAALREANEVVGHDTDCASNQGEDCACIVARLESALSNTGEGWSEVETLLKDISEAWLSSATPQEFWDKFRDGDLWGRIVQFTGPTCPDALEVK